MTLFSDQHTSTLTPSYIPHVCILPLFSHLAHTCRNFGTLFSDVADLYPAEDTSIQRGTVFSRNTAFSGGAIAVSSEPAGVIAVRPASRL